MADDIEELTVGVASGTLLVSIIVAGITAVEVILPLANGCCHRHLAYDDAPHEKPLFVKLWQDDRAGGLER
jgi:hypothetical protein